MPGSSVRRGIGESDVFNDVLKRIVDEVEGASCALLAGFDGMVVAAAARDGGPSPDLVAASMADLFRKTRAAHGDAGLAAPAEFTSGGPAGCVVVRLVTPEYVLAVVLGPEGSLGRARFELRKASAVLEPELA